MKKTETLTGKNLPRLAVAKPGWPEQATCAYVSDRVFDGTRKISPDDAARLRENYLQTQKQRGRLI